jgi:hypothetical protein
VGFDENGEEAAFEWKNGGLDGEGEGEEDEGVLTLFIHELYLSH